MGNEDGDPAGYGDSCPEDAAGLIVGVLVLHFRVGDQDPLGGQQRIAGKDGVAVGGGSVKPDGGSKIAVPAQHTGNCFRLSGILPGGA